MRTVLVDNPSGMLHVVGLSFGSALARTRRLGSP
jgi:hypothetical protein